MLAAIIIITSITQIILSLFVLLRSKSNLSNRLFFFMGIASLGWALASYLSIVFLHSPRLVDIVRFILFFVVIQNTFFYMFARTFPKLTWDYSRKWLFAYLLFSVIAALAALSPFVFTSVAVNKIAVTKAGPAILIFIAHAVLSIFVAFRAFIKKIHRSEGAQKRQLQILLFASFLIWIVVPITNFAITPLLKTTIFVVLAPIYTLAFASIIAYAIVSQKLFDIRTAVARSVGYVLVLGTIALIYGVVLFGVINVFLPDQAHATQREILSIVLVAPLVLSFQSLKKFFDNLTRQLFYRDSYDIQEVLDELGDVVVAEINLDKILNSTRRVLTRALKSGFIEFVLIRDDKPYLEVHNRWKSNIDSFNITKHIREQHRELFVVDELESESYLKNEFKRTDIALSLRLKTQDQVVGYILFGEKNSGDTYNSKDRNLLLIVANELSITVQNALRFEQIQEFNTTLQYKVESATHQLRGANERLRELDAVKDDFISMASHQLRTPLTSIKGYVGMVLEGDAGKITKMQHKFLDQALTSSKRMTSLVTDMLNVSRIESGKFFIDARPTNLQVVTEEILNELAGMAKDKNVTLAFNKPDHFPLVKLDEDKINQVIMNFTDNAIHYSKEGGHIKLELAETPTNIEMKVIDDGIGVPREAQKSLFTKFFRAGNAKTARPDGTGIGLYLAKEVITAQGGTLIFHSEENKGSTFGFSFSKDKVLVKD